MEEKFQGLQIIFCSCTLETYYWKILKRILQLSTFFVNVCYGVWTWQSNILKYPVTPFFQQGWTLNALAITVLADLETPWLIILIASNTTRQNPCQEAISYTTVCSLHHIHVSLTLLSKLKCYVLFWIITPFIYERPVLWVNSTLCILSWTLSTRIASFKLKNVLFQTLWQPICKQHNIRVANTVPVREVTTLLILCSLMHSVNALYGSEPQNTDTGNVKTLLTLQRV